MSNFDIDWKTIGELYIEPVMDPDSNPLGWAVCVLIDNGKQAEFLVLMEKHIRLVQEVEEGQGEWK